MVHGSCHHFSPTMCSDESKLRLLVTHRVKYKVNVGCVRSKGPRTVNLIHVGNTPPADGGGLPGRAPVQRQREPRPVRRLCLPAGLGRPALRAPRLQAEFGERRGGVHRKSGLPHRWRPVRERLLPVVGRRLRPTRRRRQHGRPQLPERLLGVGHLQPGERHLQVPPWLQWARLLGRRLSEWVLRPRHLRARGAAPRRPLLLGRWRRAHRRRLSVRRCTHRPRLLAPAMSERLQRAWRVPERDLRVRPLLWR